MLAYHEGLSFDCSTGGVDETRLEFFCCASRAMECDRSEKLTTSQPEKGCECDDLWSRLLVDPTVGVDEWARSVDSDGDWFEGSPRHLANFDS